MARVRVKIYGLNLSRLINLLIIEGVYLSHVQIKNKFIVFSLNEKDKVILDKICKRERKQYKIIGTNSFKNLLLKVPYIFGSYFAIMLCLFYMVSFNFYIYHIKIENESIIDYDTKKVVQILNHNGIHYGMSKYKFNEKEIENILLKNLTDIKGCSVFFNGNNLTIKIFPEELSENNISKVLISKYDAVVTKIDNYSGDVHFKVGDIVKKGDVLISSDYEAKGKIKGKVYFSKSKLYNKVQQKQVLTGKFKTIKTLSIFDKCLLKTQNNIYFSNYLTKKCDFYLFKNFLIPIKCVEIYYFETKLIEEIVEFETVEEKIKNELYDEVVQDVPDGVNVENCTYSVICEGDLTRVDCFVECELDLI